MKILVSCENIDVEPPPVVVQSYYILHTDLDLLLLLFYYYLTITTKSYYPLQGIYNHLAETNHVTSVLVLQVLCKYNLWYMQCYLPC